MSEVVRGLVIGHSTLADGLTSAVRQIAGLEDGVLQPFSNEGQSPESLIAAVQHAVGNAPVILFTDLGSGSCAFAARKIAALRPRTGVVCGVNLPILLDFAFHRDLPLTELVERLIEKGKGGIVGACTEEAAHADRAATH
jgi:mannose/fructose-specific phosphotransferase system component IIA